MILFETDTKAASVGGSGLPVSVCGWSSGETVSIGDCLLLAGLYGFDWISQPPGGRIPSSLLRLPYTRGVRRG